MLKKAPQVVTEHVALVQTECAHIISASTVMDVHVNNKVRFTVLLNDYQVTCFA
jgi:hypothetical protein